MTTGTIRSLLLAAALVAATAAPLAAQVQVRAGPLAGVAFSKLHGEGVESDSRTGVVAGGFAEFRVGRVLALEPQAIFVQKGATTTEEGVDVTLKLDYLEIPLLLTASMPASGSRVRPSVFAGPAIAFRTTCKATGEAGGVSETLTCEELIQQTGVDPGFNKTEFSLVLGAGLELAELRLQGRYDLGLTKITDDGTAKHRVILLTLGYAFRVR